MGCWLKLLPAVVGVQLLLVSIGANSVAVAQDAACIRDDFVAVVDRAAGTLRDLNKSNKADFQNKLRELKTKNSWSNEEYLKGAEPYVRDPKIAEFDVMSAKLLGEIATLGQEGSEASTLDCGVLAQLRSRMEVLVKTQESKWAYMFENINKALAQ